MTQSYLPTRVRDLGVYPQLRQSLVESYLWAELAPVAREKPQAKRHKCWKAQELLIGH